MGIQGDAASALRAIRQTIRAHARADEAPALARLAEGAALTQADRAAISTRAAKLVDRVRDEASPGLMEVFLAEYGLSTREGVALMCLAEALLRVPDAETIDALIEDKIAPSDWGAHLGRSASPLVNASTWALLLTGRVLREDDSGLVGVLRGAAKRLGEPVIRAAANRAMKEMGAQFVLGQTIEEAMRRGAREAADGLTFSYDMLGEAARTDADARRYHLAYSDAIAELARAPGSDIRDRPGISVKLSALHPRYEAAQRQRVMDELAPRLMSLAMLAKSAGIGLNIDAEEADRLDLSLDVIETVLSAPGLAGWDGFGVVVQAYGQRAPFVLDWLHALASALDRKIMVRLVKGAYWDAEIKRAQVMGLDGFPVFTRKASSDVSWIACARKLLDMSDRIFPQFATHNAHSVAAVLEMAGERRDFEFQRLHGMGEALHDIARKEAGARLRVYAPVGAHEDLLAYLVRRLLENGANSSFVHQIVDRAIPAARIAADPLEAVEGWGAEAANPRIPRGPALFGPSRRNARGWDPAEPDDLAEIEAARAPFRDHRWTAPPMTAFAAEGAGTVEIRNPANHDDLVGQVTWASADDAREAVAAAAEAQPAWEALDAAGRAAILRRGADLYEAHFGELFALAAREAGKTVPDCIAELREAVDFMRYYAAEAERLEGTGAARGVIACISPWNFPLAIFTGQLSAALAAGNAVVAKPAEQTPLIAARAAALLHEAGVPAGALQLLPGDGRVGAALSSAPGIAGLAFTGSTETARRIDRAMAGAAAPDAPLIAETGGLNAMIVDTTALPEQAVRDIVASSFQSAGQRCSALRVLCVQKEAAGRLRKMLGGALDALKVGDPWDIATDVGPVIDAEARAKIEAHVKAAQDEGRLAARIPAPARGTFVAPAVVSVGALGDVTEEIFGPVLHVAEFGAESDGEGVDGVIDAVNASGYGLTFGLHTRIDDRVQHVVDRIEAGNVYVNRNQIGAVVGSQPFGGEGLSGTGPKAGGPRYLRRFLRPAPGAEAPPPADGAKAADPTAAATALAALNPAKGPLETMEMPGPTGESNRYSVHPRGVALCLGTTAEGARALAEAARAAGCGALVVAPGAGGKGEIDGWLDPASLETLGGFAVVAASADIASLSAMRRAMAARAGAIVPLATSPADADLFVMERHLCIDTTAAGGNASLLASAEGT